MTAQRYDGYSWRSVVTLGKLESLRTEQKVLGSVDCEVPPPNEGSMDPEVFTIKVTLYPAMFPSELRLPFWAL